MKLTLEFQIAFAKREGQNLATIVSLADAVAINGKYYLCGSDIRGTYYRLQCDSKQVGYLLDVKREQEDGMFFSEFTVVFRPHSVVKPFAEVKLGAEADSVSILHDVPGGCLIKGECVDLKWIGEELYCLAHGWPSSWR